MQEIVGWLAGQGIYPKSVLIDDGRIRRFTHEGERRSNWVYQITPHFAWFRSHKEGVTYKWSDTSTASPERVAERKAAIKAADAELKKLRKAAVKKAGEIWDGALAANPEHPYLLRKGIKPYNARQVGDALVVPCYRDGEFKTIQRIFAEGGKLFWKGSDCDSIYNMLVGDGEDVGVIILCEGFATAASIRESTSLPVVMAFTASNLPKVAKAMRKMYPGVKLVVAADNDATGIKYAKECLPLGAEVHICPLEGKDYNDLHLEQGVGAVRDALVKRINWDEGLEQSDNPFADNVRHLPSKEVMPPDSDIDMGDHFRVLGCDNGTYYYFPTTTQQLVVLPSGAHTMSNFLRLAPLWAWQDAGLEKVEQITDYLMGQAHKKGIFREDEQLRGRGLWLDKGHAIYNNGEFLYVDGCQPRGIGAWDSRYIYIKSKSTPAPLDGMTNAEANKLRQICERFTWVNKLSGTLLAGWIVVALAGGCLRWRPHIWITGESGTGKTTIIEDLLMRVMHYLTERVEGGTTEAALRQMIGNDCRPIIYDEAEPESDKDKVVMEGVLSLSRKASSGASIIKGSVNGVPINYYCRSAFCFSSINPPIKHYADATRISLLDLYKPLDTTGFPAFREEILGVVTEEYSRKLLGRIISNLPALLENCKTFTNASVGVLGDRRAADQIGVLLAGAYMLSSKGMVTKEAAEKFVDENDASAYTAVDEVKDPHKLLGFICSQRIKLEGRTEEYTIGTLLRRSYNELDHLNSEIKETLKIYGIWPKAERVWFANTSSLLEQRLAKTPWVKWSTTLIRLKDAERTTPTKFSNGAASTRAISIPKHYVLDVSDEIDTDIYAAA